MSHIASVRTDLTLRLLVQGGPSLPVTAAVRYDAADPYAVHVTFLTGGGDSVEWVFARSLLTDGVTAPAGQGDVRVWPVERSGERLLSIAMSSPSGAALFEAARDDVVEFLTQTYVAVPTGAEESFVDLDAELALLLEQ